MTRKHFIAMLLSTFAWVNVLLGYKREDRNIWINHGDKWVKTDVIVDDEARELLDQVTNMLKQHTEGKLDITHFAKWS